MIATTKSLTGLLLAASAVVLFPCFVLAGSVFVGLYLGSVFAAIAVGAIGLFLSATHVPQQCLRFVVWLDPNSRRQQGGN